MALTATEKAVRVANGKNLIALYYKNAGLKESYADLEKVLQATDSFASEPFYQRLGGMIATAIAAGPAWKTDAMMVDDINAAVVALAKANNGVMLKTNEIGIFGDTLVDVANSLPNRIARKVSQYGSKPVNYILDVPSALIPQSIKDVIKVGAPLAIYAYVGLGLLGAYMLVKATSDRVRG
jgi:hypothetical protein